MIQKVLPITNEIKKPLLRSNLKRTSNLKNLNTRLIRDEASFKASHDMVIPGGMTQKEEFVYKLTGKYSKSVTERWYEVHGSDANNVSPNDQLVSTDTETLANTSYGEGIYSSDVTPDNNENEGFIGRIINHLFED